MPKREKITVFSGVLGYEIEVTPGEQIHVGGDEDGPNYEMWDECYVCGEVVEDAEGMECIEGKMYCEECIETNVVECSVCGKRFFKEDHNDPNVCYDCEHYQDVMETIEYFRRKRETMYKIWKKLVKLHLIKTSVSFRRSRYYRTAHISLIKEKERLDRVQKEPKK